MPQPTRSVMDGNEAVARVAHLFSEVIAIYPITPASPMGEHADDWSASGAANLWGTVPEVIEMQSEAGAAGALHGAVTRGALAHHVHRVSQGLLLMLPNMYKIAGELTPAVIHVAARSLATHALSIFGDHTDVMAARRTGFAMLCASSVQEAGRLRRGGPRRHAREPGAVPALLRRLPHQPRAQHRSTLLDRGQILRAGHRPARSRDHRLRGLDPDRPVLRGTAQNPDVFFQAREACNPFHAAVPGHRAATFDRLAEVTGRRYGLVDYDGRPRRRPGRRPHGLGRRCGPRGGRRAERPRASGSAC